jgi:hypothetical protein
LTFACFGDIAKGDLTLQYNTWPDVAGSVINTGTSATPGTIVNSSLTTYGPKPPTASTSVLASVHFADGGGADATGIQSGIPTSSLFGAGGAFTAGAWVNLDAATADSGDHMVFGADAGNGQGMHLGFRGGQAYFGFWGNDSNEPGTSAPAGKWAYFTWVYDPTVGGGTQSIYENGALLNASGNHGAYANGGNLIVGDDDFGNGSLDGSVADLRIYNTAFSAAQVASLFQQEFVPEPSTIISLLGLSGAGLICFIARRLKAPRK